MTPPAGGGGGGLFAVLLLFNSLLLVGDNIFLYSVRPETTCPWLMFGLVAACTFTLIGWRKWGDLPPTIVTVVVVMANVTTTLASVLMLHVGFHGRLIALYQGNLQRVQFLSKLLRWGG